MKRIAVLGSTGSIGSNTLDIIRRFPEEFKLVALSANSNADGLYRQIKYFRPESVCINDAKAALALKSRVGLKGIKIFTGQEGLKAMIQCGRIDKVVLAISGSDALFPLLAAIDNTKEIALANKEAIVMAGAIIMDRAKSKRVKIIPIDSEQSAIWQCINGRGSDRLKKIYLTASGGPFRRTSRKNLKDISVNKVIKHPRWKMGRKISVDSATLMNKGLEVLEAMFLFGVGIEKIKVLIHPEAIIHSMVELIDGVILAQLSVTDMRIPIQYALSYPERLPSQLPSIDFPKLGGLRFEEANFRRFPCLELAYWAAREQGVMPCVLNAANEISVEEFLKGRLKFISISKVIEKVSNRHKNISNPKLEDILKADAWARQEARRFINRL